MKAILQFATTDAGPWNDWGPVRTAKGQDYIVTGLFTGDRNGELQFVGSRTEVTSTALTLPPGFLNAAKYYFRLIYPEDPATIFNLMERVYKLNFDASHESNKISEYTINIEFVTPLNSLPVIPPEPKDIGRISTLRQYGGPGRAYAVHYDPEGNQDALDKRETVSFNSVFEGYI